MSEKGATGEEQFTEGALRAVTGAGGPKEERPLTKSQFFPTAFQSANPELRQRLGQIRASELATALRIAGPALAKRTDTAPAPAVGEVVKGHRFKGGNPAFKSSWEPL